MPKRNNWATREKGKRKTKDKILQKRSPLRHTHTHIQWYMIYLRCQTLCDLILMILAYLFLPPNGWRLMIARNACVHNTYIYRCHPAFFELIHFTCVYRSIFTFPCLLLVLLCGARWWIHLCDSNLPMASTYLHADVYCTYIAYCAACDPVFSFALITLWLEWCTHTHTTASSKQQHQQWHLGDAVI